MANSHRLMIVDDDPLNAKTLAEIFKLYGYEVEVAHSGQAALALITKSEFSVILSDIKMDGMNGVELVRLVKAVRPAIPFILMTAYTDDELIMQGIRAGALVTLIKPLDIEKLLVQIVNLTKPVKRY